MATESSYRIHHLQKARIEKAYDCFRCRLLEHGKCIVCTGRLKPLPEIEEYRVTIQQVDGTAPYVFITSPEIAYNEEIHMYKDRRLCLYFPEDMKWTSNLSIAELTIPWINEWIIYYELYKISGKWEGPSAPHKPTT